jgi:hypothetical protein
MGALQLTRYSSGQYYDWHMDLGASQASLRKVSLVVELASAQKAVVWKSSTATEFIQYPPVLAT